MLHIGLLAYGRSPLAILPAGRIRALLAEAALANARLLLFAASDCDARRGSVAAETWDGGGFIRLETTLPDVVLSVGLPIRPADADPVRWLRARVPFIEDPGPDKLWIARHLADAPYLIPWAELPSDRAAATLRAWLASEGSSVVKTAEGKRGSGLHFLDRLPGGGWSVRHDAGILRGGLDDVVAHVARRIAGRGRYRRYLVQRYVRSVTPDGRAVDLRVHVQRNGQGQWGVTRAYARLGEYGLPMSNVSRGGYQGEPGGFLRGRGLADGDAEARLHTLALDVAARMEAALGEPISELGVDVAIDPDNRLWLIEANTYPATSLHELDRAVHTIAYARHVAGSAA